MGMVQADSHAYIPKLLGRFKIGSQVPDNLTRFMINDTGRVGLPTVINDVVGMKR